VRQPSDRALLHLPMSKQGTNFRSQIRARIIKGRLRKQT